MSFESPRPISTTQTAIKATQYSLQALGSKQPKLRSSSPDGAWLPKMFMESRKPEQRTFPLAADRLPELITTSVTALTDTVTAYNLPLTVRKTLFADEELEGIHIWMCERAAVWGCLSHAACSKCSPIGRWPPVTQPVSLETGCPPLHSCPSPNEILVQSLTLLQCRQKGKVTVLVPWHKDQIYHAAHF